MGAGWAAVAQAATGLAQTGMQLWNSAQDRKVAKRNTDKTIQGNMELSKYAYGQDREMWNLQNEYNTPANQMERFKAAGLNPNMIYGHGTPGNASQMPKYNAIRQDYNYKPLQIPNVISNFQDIAMKSAQIDNVREQTNLTKLNQAIAAIRPKMIADQRSMLALKMHGEGYRNSIARSNSVAAFEMEKYAHDFAKVKLNSLLTDVLSKQQDVRNKGLSGDLKQMDKEWYDWMKGTGIAGKNLAPLLRLFIK